MYKIAPSIYLIRCIKRYLKYLSSVHTLYPKVGLPHLSHLSKMHNFQNIKNMLVLQTTLIKNALCTFPINLSYLSSLYWCSFKCSLVFINTVNIFKLLFYIIWSTGMVKLDKLICIFALVYVIKIEYGKC